jgi:hypothetical protein
MLGHYNKIFCTYTFAYVQRDCLQYNFAQSFRELKLQKMLQNNETEQQQQQQQQQQKKQIETTILKQKRHKQQQTNRPK